jgi:uncharacterized protein
VPVSAAEAVPTAAPARRSLRALRFGATLTGTGLLLFGVPWWTLFVSGAQWPAAVVAAGTVLSLGALLTFPPLMVAGHGRRHLDWAARTGDTILGVVGILFTWAILGNLLGVGLAIGGVTDPARSRIVAATVAIVSLALAVWGYVEAMRVPRVRRVDVTIPRLGAGLDGVTVVLLTDTHYGPIDRARWSTRVVDAVNTLDADIVCHTGDIADGTVEQRRAQAAPLGEVRAKLARAYVTGNHEYFGEAQGWLDHMRELGWEALHNRHVVVERGGARLVIAGVDDRTAAASGLRGHHADHAAALAGADPLLPVLLLAHQPKQVDGAVAHGVDLQISGHTHGGQMWPINYLVPLQQPMLEGKATVGDTTVVTSRGAGAWGPAIRVAAPPEVPIITLRRS